MTNALVTSDLAAAVAAVPYWYHKIALPGGVTTPGWAPLNHDSYQLPDTLTNQRVLDIGAWDGYWTFEAMKRGAREVVAIDDFSDVRNFRPGFKEWDTFDLCRDALGYDHDRCKRREMRADAINFRDLGTFDTVLCFGVLYHCRHPLWVLDKISSVCRGEIFVESAICDDYSAYRGDGGGYPSNDPHCVAEFFPGKEYGGNDTNWWAPNLRCLWAMMVSAGWNEVNVWKLCADPKGNLPLCRGFAHGMKHPVI